MKKKTVKEITKFIVTRENSLETRKEYVNELSTEEMRDVLYSVVEMWKPLEHDKQ